MFDKKGRKEEATESVDQDPSNILIRCRLKYLSITIIHTIHKIQ